MKTALQELHDHLVSAWSSPGDLWRPDLIIEKVSRMISIEKERENAELTRTNAQLDEMVTKYNELSKKYADLRKKHYSQ